jgi:hypothetical protein
MGLERHIKRGLSELTVMSIVDNGIDQNARTDGAVLRYRDP